MLRQIIYYSKALYSNNDSVVKDIETKSLENNKKNNLTGILMFDGSQYFQVLEGEQDNLYRIFDKILSDPRHSSIVKVSDRVIRTRDFAQWTFGVIKVTRKKHKSYWDLDRYRLTKDSRIYSLVNNFASGRWNKESRAVVVAKPNNLEANQDIKLVSKTYQDYNFAYQPIVDIAQGATTSLEALLRLDSGEIPTDSLGLKSQQALDEFDLHSKAIALEQVSPHLRHNQALSINVLPSTIINRPDATEFFLSKISSNHLQPEQLFIEVSETEVIRDMDNFLKASEEMRSKGIKIVLDDFGAGHAGLTLLSEFLPDKIKIDSKLVEDVYDTAVKQAIISAIIEFSATMGIPIVAEGVEKVEDWQCLRDLGIQKFQGYLFAMPRQQCIPKVNWGNIW